MTESQQPSDFISKGLLCNVFFKDLILVTGRISCDTKALGLGRASCFAGIRTLHGDGIVVTMDGIIDWREIFGDSRFMFGVILSSKDLIDTNDSMCSNSNNVVSQVRK